MATWYLAVCRDCTPRLPMPFLDQEPRDRWADDHASATGHVVDRHVEVLDPKITVPAISACLVAASRIDLLLSELERLLGILAIEDGQQRRLSLADVHGRALELVRHDVRMVTRRARLDYEITPPRAVISLRPPARDPDDAAILMPCEGSGCPTHDLGPHICMMCGQAVAVDDGGNALDHSRQDILAMIERGDFR